MANKILELVEEVEMPLRELQQQQFKLLNDDELGALIGGLEKVRESMARANHLR